MFGCQLQSIAYQLEISMTKLLRDDVARAARPHHRGRSKRSGGIGFAHGREHRTAGGCATLHANNAKSARDRMEMLISMNPDAPRAIEPFIAAAVDVVIHIAKTPDGRRVQEMIEVRGYENGYETHNIGGGNV